jgi:hypothetical protein
MILATLALAAQPVPLPQYRLRDAFVFSDGRVERVVEVKQDKVVWAGLSGPAYTRSRNFIMPVESWQSRSGSGRRTVIGAPQALWPVAGPRSSRFRVVTETRKRADGPWRRSVTLWTCQSLKPREIRLKMGDLRTIPFRCDRYSAANMRLIERLEWDYSADVGHYVRRGSIDYLRGTKRTIELVATVSGPSASLRRLAAISRAARRGDAIANAQ